MQHQTNENISHHNDCQLDTKEFDGCCRFDYNQSFGGKISKQIEYTEYLNLRPYMTSQVRSVHKNVWFQKISIPPPWELPIILNFTLSLILAVRTPLPEYGYFLEPRNKYIIF